MSFVALGVLAAAKPGMPSRMWSIARAQVLEAAWFGEREHARVSYDSVSSPGARSSSEHSASDEWLGRYSARSFAERRHFSSLCSFRKSRSPSYLLFVVRIVICEVHLRHAPCRMKSASINFSEKVVHWLTILSVFWFSGFID